MARAAFSKSIGRACWFNIFLIVVGFLTTLFIPELALRKSNDVPPTE